MTTERAGSLRERREEREKKCILDGCLAQHVQSLPLGCEKGQGRQALLVGRHISIRQRSHKMQDIFERFTTTSGRELSTVSL